MHPVLYLVIYAALCVVAALAGGWVPLFLRLTHRRMQLALSFVSGVILGIGLLHLVPHSFSILGSIDLTVWWVLAGFLFMFFLERFFHFHHHDAPDDAAVEHEHDHDHDHLHEHTQEVSGLSGAGATVGLALHGLIDGVAIAAAVTADTVAGSLAWAGLGTALAVILHKPFDSLTIGTLLAAAGHSSRWRHVCNALYALITPLGILLYYAASSRMSDPTAGLGEVLAFAAGAFICISSSDLLPELQFHRHDRTKLSLALLLGIALAWSTVFLEEAGHDHGQEHHETHEHPHEHAHPHE